MPMPFSPFDSPRASARLRYAPSESTLLRCSGEAKTPMASNTWYLGSVETRNEAGVTNDSIVPTLTPSTMRGIWPSWLAG